jgi:hypothetical protein
MPLYTTNPDAGYMHAEAPELDRKLREGDGILWPGDPRLELRMGIISDRTGKIRARRYEVWRNMEDGSEQRLGHWRLEEFDRILLDLGPMRLDAPGHVDAVDRIEKHNQAHEAKVWQRGRDAMGEMMSHAASILHDTTQPKNVFRQVGGMRDKVKPDAQ